MKRRIFIKNAGVLASSLFLEQQMVSAFSFSGNSRRINIGIIGCGDRGKGIMHILNELPDKFSITAICDNLDFRLKEAQLIKTSAQLKVYKDYRSLLEDKNVDAVVIATPLNLHFPMAADAIGAGKHVYLEKTMTYNIPETKKLVKIVKDNPALTFQVGHQYRYTPLYHQVKKMIENDFLGKVVQIDCRWDRNGNWRRNVKDASLERKVNWRMYNEYSGGLPAELLSHQLDFINWTFNTHPDEIMATGGVDFYKDGRETFDNVQAVLRYSKEAMIGNFGATCANAKEGYSFKIKGNKGSITLFMNKGIFYPEKEMMEELTTVDGVTGATKLMLEKEGGMPIMKEPTKDGTWYAFTDFHNSIVTKAPCSSSVYTGATTSYCVHSINEAMFTNSIQKWKPEFDF